MNKKFLKKTAVVLAGGVISIYALFLIAPFVITSFVNGYVPQINEEIKKATGLNSSIKDFKLVTTPKLTVGAKIGEFALSLPNDKKLLNANNFEVKMSLLPLLAKRIEIDVVKLDNLDVKLGVNKDGGFEIEKYLPVSEPAEQTEAQEPLNLPLKLSNHLPDIKVGGYNIEFVDLSTNKSYKIAGGKTEVTDFVLNKSIKILADGKITLDDREQFKYNLKINNKIMPDLDLYELVFNPQPEEDKPKTNNEPVNILEIFKGLYNYKITANLDGNLTLTKDSKNGYINLDNLSVINLPPSDAKLNFRGHKIDIDSNIYTAKNEVSTIKGFVKDKNIDLNFKSGVELSNIVKILNAVAMTFNVKDLQTLTANGKLDADFTVKSNMKKVSSNGYLKIPSAKVFYGLYNIGIDNINADVALNNNNIDIKNIGFSILGQPLKFYGLIKQDATADLHLTADKLSLRGLIIACGQGALLKDIDVKSGLVSLNVDLVGKLDKIQPVAKATLTNLLLSNPMASISVPKITADIKEDEIEISQTAVKVEKINFNVSGKIKNYLTEKISLNFVTTGDIKSTLSGDMNIVKQTLNLIFMAQNSTIIVPMFDKSKMTFNGNISITGNMMNPILSGVVKVPSLNIPEIPVTMDNLVAKLNGTILKGNASVAKFTSGGIAAQDITSDFSMKGENFYLSNLKGTAFDGKINGNIIYNLNNAKTSIDFAGFGMNAEKAIAGAAGIKNALSGTLEFNTKMTLVVADYNDMMRSLGGNLSFKVANGAFGSIGRLENFLGAANIAGNTILKSTVATLSNLAGIKNTAEFDYIQGNMTFSNGWANLKSIKSTGKTLAYFVYGKYNLVNGTTNVTVLGRLDASVVKLLGPVGELSADKLFAAIPKFGALTKSIVGVLTTDPKGERIAEIPALTGESTGHKDFKVMFNGGIESKSSIKSFKWLTKVDTSQLEQKSVGETIKSLKESVDTDLTNTVKGVADTVKNQKELFKNSAQELKSLFKF